jgi:hypothetical protein
VGPPLVGRETPGRVLGPPADAARGHRRVHSQSDAGSSARRSAAGRRNHRHRTTIHGRQRRDRDDRLIPPTVSPRGFAFLRRSAEVPALNRRAPSPTSASVTASGRSHATASPATTKSSQLPRTTRRSRPGGRQSRLAAAAAPSPNRPPWPGRRRWRRLGGPRPAARTPSTPLAAAKVSDSKLASGAGRSRRNRSGTPTLADEVHGHQHGTDGSREPADIPNRVEGAWLVPARRGRPPR